MPPETNAEIPSIPFAEFSAPFMREITARRIPVNVLFELTYRCNFDCVHCYVVEQRPKGELETHEILRVLEGLKAAGTLFVTFTGGEPLTRPDFPEIYLAAKRLGFMVSLYTNAALVQEPLLDLLEGAPPHKVEVTLYGASEETYQASTRRKNMHDLVLANVDRMRARGLRVYLKTIGMIETKGEIEAIAAEAEKRGVQDRFRMDNVLTVRTDCRRGPAAHRLSPADVVEQDRDDEKRVKDYRRLYLLDRGRRVMTRRLFRCGAGTSQVVVDPKGRLQTCSLYRQEFFDLRQGTVSEGWQHLQGVVEARITRPTRCRSCDKVSLCGSCPGNNALESGGDPEQPPDYLCEIAYARLDAFCDDLRPRVPEPAGRWLPLHRRQECQRPWLHRVREPIGRLEWPGAPRRAARPLPVLRRAAL